MKLGDSLKQIYILGDKTTWVNYSNAIEFCGGTVVFSNEIEDSKSCDGLLLTGGYDLNPMLYGEKNLHSEHIDDFRDDKELELIRIFSELNKPILGICRGLQVLNVAFDGTLIQDVENVQTHSRCGSNYDKIHTVNSEKENFITKLYSNKFSVNSSHHQAIGKLSSEFTPLVRSNDGIIEAIMHKEKPIFAVQWHPERMMLNHQQSETVDGKHIFCSFLLLC